VNIILDTHIFIWALTQPERPSQKYREYIENLTNEIFVSSISIAEIAIKSSIGKLDYSFDLDDVIYESGFESLNFTVADAILLKDLPFHHRDPFDRMLIAQSISTGYYIISDDAKLGAYNCKLL
jgi:PIN domain nuclease of toxin-antitoxin system